MRPEQTAWRDVSEVLSTGQRAPSGEFMGSIPVTDIGAAYQPIVRMATGSLFAYEVLARPRAALRLTPERLFELASLHNACGRLGRLLRRLALPACAGRAVFLNVHPEELVDRWILQPDDPLFGHDNEVYLEITESVPLTHFDLVRATLDELRSRGHVHLVVDDLGAGYSNLRRIADLAPQIVKLDRCLVTGLDRNDRQYRLVRAVVRMCEDLGAEVVAEGIETLDELEAVRDAGAHYGQGFVLGRPASLPPPVIWHAR